MKQMCLKKTIVRLTVAILIRGGVISTMAAVW